MLLKLRIYSFIKYISFNLFLRNIFLKKITNLLYNKDYYDGHNANIILLFDNRYKIFTTHKVFALISLERIIGRIVAKLAVSILQQVKILTERIKLLKEHFS